jgi:hypothetical protein
VRFKFGRSGFALSTINSTERERNSDLAETIAHGIARQKVAIGSMLLTGCALLTGGSSTKAKS